MFILQSNRKIGFLLLTITFLLTLTSCGLEEQEITMYAMNPFSTQLDSDLPSWIVDKLPADVDRGFYYAEQDVNVLLYVEDSQEPAVVWINEEKYPFSYGYGYSPMESEAPFISIRDINKDTRLDVLMHGISYRTEWRQDVYLSDGEGGYTELGDVTWNKADMVHSLQFTANYEEAYRVRITAPEWNIDEIKDVEGYLLEELIPLGLYDEEGKLTDYGRNWELSQLQGSSVTYRQDEDGNTYLFYEAEIEAGYSEYTIGCGFRFEYLISDGVYELKNVILK